MMTSAKLGWKPVCVLCNHYLNEISSISKSQMVTLQVYIFQMDCKDDLMNKEKMFNNFRVWKTWNNSRNSKYHCHWTVKRKFEDSGHNSDADFIGTISRLHLTKMYPV